MLHLNDNAFCSNTCIVNIITGNMIIRNRSVCLTEQHISYLNRLRGKKGHVYSALYHACPIPRRVFKKKKKKRRLLQFSNSVPCPCRRELEKRAGIRFLFSPLGTGRHVPFLKDLCWSICLFFGVFLWNGMLDTKCLFAVSSISFLGSSVSFLEFRICFGVLYLSVFGERECWIWNSILKELNNH